MKQKVSPGVMIGVIVIGVILIAVVAWRALRGPSVPVAADTGSAAGKTNPMTGGMSANDAPSPKMAEREAQMKKIEANMKMHSAR